MSTHELEHVWVQLRKVPVHTSEDQGEVTIHVDPGVEARADESAPVGCDVCHISIEEGIGTPCPGPDYDKAPR